MKYLKQFRERFRGREKFSINDAKKFLSQKWSTGQYIKLLIHNLVKNGEIFRIAKGSYTFTRDFSKLESVFSPSYHGLQEALSIHKIWGQATNQILITPRKVRSGQRVALGRKVIIRRISRKMFFGDQMVNYAGEWFNVSDPEKTLIDFAYFNEPLESKTLKALLKKTDMEILESYLKLCSARTQKKTMKMVAQSQKHDPKTAF